MAAVAFNIAMAFIYICKRNKSGSKSSTLNVLLLLQLLLMLSTVTATVCTVAGSNITWIIIWGQTLLWFRFSRRAWYKPSMKRLPPKYSRGTWQQQVNSQWNGCRSTAQLGFIWFNFSVIALERMYGSSARWTEY